MLKKRYRYYNDPIRINNYNKFLSTLDSKNKDPIPSNPYEGNNENKEDIKKEIDQIIEMINKRLNLNGYMSEFFTGMNPSDDKVCKYDPNDYYLYSNKNVKLASIPSPVKKINPKKREETVEIKETVQIDATVDCISDLLSLTDKYKYDPSIKYNIDMKALHDIKEPLEELNNMIGMKHLKNNIVDQILYFVQKLHKNKNESGEFLHTVIYGPPGTGKTEVAKIMGKIYSKIGILSSGTFKKVTRSDLVAGYLGQTALKTKEVIKESLGGVLFIDEAYSLGNTEKKDSFSKECIDTLCEALSDNKDNLMVIIAGYEKELKECFFNYNQGLDSRFTWRFKTDEYSYEDLHNIFLKKVKDVGWEMEDNLDKCTLDWFKKNKDCFGYYGRDIETLLSKTKIAHSRRVFSRPESEKKKLSMTDLEKGFEIYLKNDSSKNKKEEEELKRYLYSTLYC